jgi:enoyl-CoA hydratase/carnithine racemase
MRPSGFQPPLRIELVIGEVRGARANEALAADYLFLSEAAVLWIDTEEAWTAVLWRLGAEALRLHLHISQPLSAAEAVRWGVADALVPSSEDPVEWVAGWLRNRSEHALGAATDLVNRRGGDTAERAVFSWLFAAGEPQQGLRAFLDKQRPDWRKPG